MTAQSSNSAHIGHHFLLMALRLRKMRRRNPTIIIIIYYYYYYYHYHYYYYYPYTPICFAYCRSTLRDETGYMSKAGDKNWPQRKVGQGGHALWLVAASVDWGPSMQSTWSRSISSRTCPYPICTTATFFTPGRCGSTILGCTTAWLTICTCGTRLRPSEGHQRRRRAWRSSWLSTALEQGNPAFTSVTSLFMSLHGSIEGPHRFCGTRDLPYLRCGGKLRLLRDAGCVRIDWRLNHFCQRDMEIQLSRVGSRDI